MLGAQPPIHCRRSSRRRGRVVDLDSNIHYEYFIYKRILQKLSSIRPGKYYGGGPH